MKRILMFFLLVSANIIARAQNDLVVDANAELRTVNGSFSTIKVSGGIDLYLSQSTEIVVAVSASGDRYKNNIITVVENGTLRIYYDGDKLFNKHKKNLRVYVSFKDLEKLEGSGASNILVLGEMAANSLTMEMSGASNFTGKIKVRTLTMTLSGASDVKLEGTATVVNIESSGASDVKGYGLATDTCTAKVSGASDVNITVNKELNAQASGASDIYYKGDAIMRTVHSTGVSTVAKKGR